MAWLVHLPGGIIYLRTAERMGIDSRNQLVFEDSHNGVRAAREAGSLPIGMPTVNRPEVIKRLEREGAVGIFLDWRAVSINSLKTIEGAPQRPEGILRGKER